MNTPEELIELAKANFPHPILLLTSSDNGRLWSLSESSQPMSLQHRYYHQARGMKFRGPGWEIHLQEVEDEVFGYHYNYDCHIMLDGSLVATWDDSRLQRQDTPNP